MRLGGSQILSSRRTGCRDRICSTRLPAHRAELESHTSEVHAVAWIEDARFRLGRRRQAQMLRGLCPPVTRQGATSFDYASSHESSTPSSGRHAARTLPSSWKAHIDAPPFSDLNALAILTPPPASSWMASWSGPSPKNVWGPGTSTRWLFAENAIRWLLEDARAFGCAFDITHVAHRAPACRANFGGRWRRTMSFSTQPSALQAVKRFAIVPTEGHDRISLESLAEICDEDPSKTRRRDLIMSSTISPTSRAPTICSAVRGARRPASLMTGRAISRAPWPRRCEGHTA